jgi:acyl-[acyl-carrier-protein] desaturase
VSLALNILTEEGLPHFHRLLSQITTVTSSLGMWTNLWTAEEDRHGGVLRDYARDAHIFDFRAFEEQQFEYLRVGFHPTWAGSPYALLVYTSLQERATQISHMKTGKIAQNYEPLLGEILQKIAEDEARHYAFYRGVFKELIGEDPNGALLAAEQMLPRIDMPGVAMPGFRDYFEVESRSGIYSVIDYKTIVEELLRYWKIDTLRGLTSEGARAQEKICGIPQRLQRVADRLAHEVKQKTFSFALTYHRAFTL